MKKFTNISGYKVGEEPKVEVKLNEEELFKAKIMNLMEQFLIIRTYGPVDRYQRAGTIKIEGKSLFLEALMDMMSDKTIKEQTKLLESLKSSVRDWEVLDTKIDEFNYKIVESREKKKTLIHRNRLSTMYNNYKEDEEMLLQIVEKSSNKITSADTAYLRAITAELMAEEGRYPKEIFCKISEKFHNRAKELGYNK